MAEPLDITEARRMCATCYPSREHAALAARKLATAGWKVIEVAPTLERVRRDGAIRVASVYDLETFESPGDLVYQPVGRSRRPGVPSIKR